VPGSSLVSVGFPSGADATWRLRVREPGELARAYGKSQVFVDANDGRVVGVFPESEAPPGRAFMDSLFAIHTGEAGGTPGRFLSLLTGLWLATMVILGLILWARRRPRKKTGTNKRQARTNDRHEHKDRIHAD